MIEGDELADFDETGAGLVESQRQILEDKVMFGFFKSKAFRNREMIL